ncbi:hypothetical protein GCM10023194_40640 [Planotetraspora phitsanulokensis]|uniref:Uncharacterized protein n=1 Tax=Planotetraspora phitsanulokensis TaxID=575192 RepID=A0A8J3U907_9ACTN|nr:hypothetical protein Pph01_59510 [Planotetraspora phitsanulokensis]
MTAPTGKSGEESQTDDQPRYLPRLIGPAETAVRLDIPFMVPPKPSRVVYKRRRSQDHTDPSAGPNATSP